MVQAKGYADVDYLKTAANLLRPIKERSFVLLGVRPGMRLLEIGCGPGTVTVDLGRRVGDEGEVVGIDLDSEMIARAEQHSAEAGLGARVRHHQADAAALPFSDNSFDGCRAERVFLHLREPLRALENMVRVTKPGGWVVVAETDFASLSFDTSETETERCLVRVRGERLFHNGFAGRQLYRLFQEAGLADVKLEVVPISVFDSQLMRYVTGLDEAEQEALANGLLSNEQVRRLHLDLAQADLNEWFFGSANIILAAGRKP
jgi:ubiquinone/menaquinone biosynthesis C-methylase UbiE